MPSRRVSSRPASTRPASPLTAPARAAYPSVVQPTVSIFQVTEIVRGARRRGLDVDRLLRRAGIPRELLESPLSRVTQQQYARLMRGLQRRTRDELCGLCERPLPPGSFAAACRAMIQCRTLGEALRAGFASLHPVLPGFVVRLRREGGQAVVRFVDGGVRPREPASIYAQRVTLFMGYGLACWLVARRIPLTELVYYEEAAGDSSEGLRVFQTPMRHDAGWMGLAFDARWLELPVVQTPDSLGAFLRETPSNLVLKYREQASLSERIRRLLRRYLAEELPSLEAVGEALSLSPQTLRRRLLREGTGFQAIKDGLRRDVAVQYLAEPGLTLMEIANRLGFSEASTFHRAFKGWTGVAPGVYRERQLRALAPRRPTEGKRSSAAAGRVRRG